ncbi:hypothetical protein ScPMuIL_002543, partial [Solemya velum]
MMERTDESQLYSAEEDVLKSCLRDISSLENLRLWSVKNGLSEHPLVVERRDELHLLNASDFDEIPTESKDSHRCHICARTYIQKRSLLRHIREKHGDMKHSCGKCGRKFDSLRQSAQHEKYCTGFELRSYDCEQCGKKCTSERRLAQHAAAHERQKTTNSTVKPPRV